MPPNPCAQYDEAAARLRGVGGHENLPIGGQERSRRKTPVVGITTASTEKRGKQLAHRRLRARERQDLQRGGEENPRLREVSDPWTMDKDGKQRIDPSWDPRLMRK
jgi:hypothetical protein